MPSTGTIITRVFTSRGQIPLENVTVSIVRRVQGSVPQLLSVQISDRSGTTQPITVPTPEIENSQSPNQPTPYALFDVWAEHPMYQLLVVQNVQVFPGISSIQNLPLIPLPQVGRQSSVEVDIPPQEL